MSVVAVKVTNKEITIGADSIRVRGGTQERDKSAKLFRSNGLIVGYSGYSSEGGLFQLFCKTHKPKEATEDGLLEFISEFQEWYRKKVGDNNGKLENHYIIVFDGKVFRVGAFFIKPIDDYDAIGAGMDFALAALYLGKDVEDAIKAACELSIYCEEPVNVIKENK